MGDYNSPRGIVKHTGEVIVINQMEENYEARNIKGRVTIFSVSGCHYCKLAKQTIDKLLKLPYYEINIDIYPKRREELIEYTNCNTVPQIFFNEFFIGGNEELEALVNDKIRLEEILTKIEQEEPPNDIDYLKPIKEEERLARRGSEKFATLNCTPDSYKDLVKKMTDEKKGVEIADRNYRFKVYKNCFIGKEAVTWLCNNLNVTRPEAVKIGNQLFDKKYFRHVVNDHAFKDKYLYYRFVHHEPQFALNKNTLSICEARPASEISSKLRRLILAIYDDFLTVDGKGVDYRGITDSDAFARYEQLTIQLQRVDVTSLSENEKKSFFINIYNALIIHAYVRVGVPSTFFQRMKFFSNNSYVIGGQLYSLNDIEHGILRCNKRSPSSFYPPFVTSEPRYQIILSNLDPRIHFALVCGAKGCPPIQTYSSNEIDDQLDSAAKSFLETGLLIKGNTITLSKILQWYQPDFGKDTNDMFHYLLPYLSKVKQLALASLMESKEYRIVYETYDWSVNSI